MKNFREHALGSAAAVALALATAGCSNAVAIIEGSPPETTVVLIDGSASVAPADRSVYLQSLKTIANGLEGGDRLMIARVGSAGRANFRAQLDLTVKQSDVRLDQDEAIKAAKSTVDNALPDLLPQHGTAPASGKTKLLGAIAAAAQAYGHAPFQHADLVLLSDGVEESGTANLAGAHITPKDIREALGRANAAGLLPNLSGLEVTVVGAGGRDYSGVEAFWRAYCQRTGAKLRTYGRLPYQPDA